MSPRSRLCGHTPAVSEGVMYQVVVFLAIFMCDLHQGLIFNHIVIFYYTPTLRVEANFLHGASCISELCEYLSWCILKMTGQRVDIVLPTTP